MSLIMAFCARLDWVGERHECELPPGHQGACACECGSCCWGGSDRLAG